MDYAHQKLPGNHICLSCTRLYSQLLGILSAIGSDLFCLYNSLKSLTLSDICYRPTKPQTKHSTPFPLLYGSDPWAPLYLLANSEKESASNPTGKMVEYVPPPKDFSKLNPIQRYMQKGSLDLSDWLRLGALVLAYWLLRPYFQTLAKKWFGTAVAEGEEEQTAYQQRREQASISNEIRSGKKSQGASGKTLSTVLEEGVDGFAESSGAKADSNGPAQNGEVKNRKQKKSKGVSFAPEKTEVDRTLDWEDESEFDPRRKPLTSQEQAEAGGDIKQWMEKWTS